MRRILITMIMLLVVISMNGQTKIITRQSASNKTAKATNNTPKSNNNQIKTKPQGKQNTQKRQTQRGKQASQPRQVQSLCPDNRHPHAIDLGLPSGTKWACCNVGANKPEGYGGYYAWGETETKSTYNWNTYNHCNGTGKTCHDLGYDIAVTDYDIAHVKWGGSWQMPSRVQIKEIVEQCNYSWITISGVKGCMFTSKKNGKSVFFPAAGVFWDNDLHYASEFANYWSSTQNPDFISHAYGPSFRSSGASWYTYGERYTGNPVRPVSR